VYFNAFKAAGARPISPIASVGRGAAVHRCAQAYRLVGECCANHAYIEGLHDWGGRLRIYDFRDGSQRGIGQNSTIMYTWDIEKADSPSPVSPEAIPRNLNSPN